MPPTTVLAKAGPDITVESGQTVRIHGMAVIENAVGATSYLWTLIQGTGGSLSATDVAEPEFTADEGIEEETTLSFMFAVTNNGVTHRDLVSVMVVPESEPSTILDAVNAMTDVVREVAVVGPAGEKGEKGDPG